MSVNCIRCVKNRRTGHDLLCDECRAAAADPPIPVAVAKEIAGRHDCQVVLLVGWRRATGRTHVITYGADAETKLFAAKGGETVSAALKLGVPDATHEDFRERTAAQWAVERDTLLDVVRDLCVELAGHAAPTSAAERRGRALVAAAAEGRLAALVTAAEATAPRYQVSYQVNGQTATGYWRVDHTGPDGPLVASAALISGAERLAERVCETMNLWHRCGELAAAAVRSQQPGGGS